MDPSDQQSILYYHGSLKSALGSDDSDTILDVYDSFINGDEEGTAKGDPYDEEYQVLPYQPKIDDIIDNSDEERAQNSYNQYIGAEVVIPDCNGDKILLKPSKHIKYDYISTIQCHYNDMHDKYVFEIYYPDVTTEQMTDNIISQNIISQVYYEFHHYQVLTEETRHNRDKSDFTKVGDFVKPINGDLQWNRTTCGWKILVEFKCSSVDSVPLKDLKQFNPVKQAQYTVANEISDQPAFKWWVKGTLRRQDRIIYDRVQDSLWNKSSI